MAWSTPATVATGELATAAWANQYIREQFNETAPAKAAAAGDTFYATAVNAIAVLSKAAADGALMHQAAGLPAWFAKGTALQTLRMNAAGTAKEWAAPSVFVRKAVDETVTNSVTLQNDDDLLFAMLANETWTFKLILSWDGPTSGTGLKVAFVGPVSSVGMFTVDAGGNGEDNQASDTFTDSAGAGISSLGNNTGTEKDSCVIQGIVRVGATAGNLQFQWAQRSPNASPTTIFLDSFLLAQQVA